MLHTNEKSHFKINSPHKQITESKYITFWKNIYNLTNSTDHLHTNTTTKSNFLQKKKHQVYNYYTAPT